MSFKAKKKKIMMHLIVWKIMLTVVNSTIGQYYENLSMGLPVSPHV